MELTILETISVALGALLTAAKVWWFQSQKNKKGAEYHSIKLQMFAKAVMCDYNPNCLNMALSSFKPKQRLAMAA